MGEGHRQVRRRADAHHQSRVDRGVHRGPDVADASQRRHPGDRLRTVEDGQRLHEGHGVERAPVQLPPDAEREARGDRHQRRGRAQVLGGDVVHRRPDPERVAVGDVVEVLQLDRVQPHPLETQDQLAGLLQGEPLQMDLGAGRVAREAGQPRGLDGRGPGGGDHEDAVAAQPAGGERQRGQRGVVGPLDVVDDDDPGVAVGLTLAERLEQGTAGHEDVVEALRLRARDVLVRQELDHRGEVQRLLLGVGPGQQHAHRSLTADPVLDEP